MLGYVNDHRDAWHTPFEFASSAPTRSGTTSSAGCPKAHVERYERGQRYYQGRWIRAAEEAQLRSDLNRGWRIESEHYVVTTNHSLEEGVRLIAAAGNSVRDLAAGICRVSGDEAELARRFEGRASRARAAAAQRVLLSHARASTTTRLRRPAANRHHAGHLFRQERTAYFFAGDDQEAEHDISRSHAPIVSGDRSRSPTTSAGRTTSGSSRASPATWSRSAEQRGYYTLGGHERRAHAGRARIGCCNDDFYVPLAQLVRFGMEAPAARPANRQDSTASASGLADFFMHDEQGRYRDPLVRYLDAVYSDRATTQTLSQLCGTSYATLDSQYRQFMAGDEKPWRYNAIGGSLIAADSTITRACSDLTCQRVHVRVPERPG